MKLCTTLLLLVLALPVSAQYTTTWERSAAGSGVPTWFGANTERGFAYGIVNGNERIYVVSRNGGNVVQVLNADTGADVSTLNTTGITGGTFAINDIEVSDDGIIIACNLTTASTATAVTPSPFKCYSWATEASAPVNVVSLTTTGNYRFGDKITVTGRADDNSLTIWAAGATGSGTATSPSAVVLKLTTADNGATFSDALITASSPTSFGNSPSVGPIPSGGFFVNGNGINPNQYDAAGTLEGTSSPVATGTNAIRYFTSDTKAYIAFFRYDGGISTGGAGVSYTGQIVDVTGGAGAGNTNYGQTPSLGTLANANGAGDVAVRDNGDDTFTVFVLATNNGLGAFTTTGAPLPVEMVSFDAVSDGSTARLTWTTASETNNAGFEVEQQVGTAFRSLGFVQGRGTTLEQHTYTFAAEDLAPGRHVFRLTQRDFDGSVWTSDEIAVEIASEMAFALSNVAPHPVAGTSAVRLYVATPQPVRVELFDVTGRLMQTLHSGLLGEGTATFALDARALPAGLYLLRATGDTASQTRQVTVVR